MESCTGYGKAKVEKPTVVFAQDECEGEFVAQATFFYPMKDFLLKGLGSKSHFFGDALAASCYDFRKQIYSDEKTTHVLFSVDGGLSLNARCPGETDIITGKQYACMRWIFFATLFFAYGPKKKHHKPPRNGRAEIISLLLIELQPKDRNWRIRVTISLPLRNVAYFKFKTTIPMKSWIPQELFHADRIFQLTSQIGQPTTPAAGNYNPLPTTSASMNSSPNRPRTPSKCCLKIDSLTRTTQKCSDSTIMWNTTRSGIIKR
ncbi:uncharacterized protein TNIN_110381 [Trichonephila inaurata madagascariensis]|uniref:Uncharacterized protein n=1 Tax=Trichonephila inaurata madagascariensis TaxID=2747483 RepID=A0A8X6XFT6_9ARAC|nr:uncharacterized protein TNIN_110381 [Trichonephila inaurata madagascariensis]